MPSLLIFSRTCRTASLRPEALTCISRSVVGCLGTSLSFPPLRRFDCESRPKRHFISAPRIWTVGNRVQLTLRIPREAERFEQRAALPDQLFRDKLADADHLVA